MTHLLSDLSPLVFLCRDLENTMELTMVVVLRSVNPLDFDVDIVVNVHVKVQCVWRAQAVKR